MIDHGFVWSQSSSPKVGYNHHRSLGPWTGKGAFSARMGATLVRGVTYHVRAYTMDRDHTVYGAQVSFVAEGGLAPVIESFTPATAFLTDTLLIKGSNFGTSKYEHSVLFDGVPGTVVSAGETALAVVVPDMLPRPSAALSLVLSGRTVAAPAEFTLAPPVIAGVTPNAGPTGTRVVITGKGFSPLVAGTSVKFGGVEALLTRVSATRLEAVVPAGVPVGNATLTVMVARQTAVAVPGFEVTAP